MLNFKIDDAIYFLGLTRQRITDVISNKSTEQLNRIPQGFKNNLIWNAGHCLATQNLLTYGLSGLPFDIDNEIIERYRKGSSPTEMVESGQIEIIKKELIESPKRLLNHYEASDFKQFKVYQTSYGAELKNVEQAIAFNNTHEGLHLGIMMAQSKLV
ncbi:MAG: DinB family protein [Bacteroidia bacterium]